MDNRVLAAITAVLASAGMLTLGLDVEVLAAIFSVLWRTEGLVQTPEWLPWVVYAGLVMVAAYQITKSIGVRRS